LFFIISHSSWRKILQANRVRRLKLRVKFAAIFTSQQLIVNSLFAGATHAAAAAAATGGDLSQPINLAYVSGSWHGRGARARVTARGFCEIRRHTRTQQLLGQDKNRTPNSRPLSREFSFTYTRRRSTKSAQPESVTVCFNYAGWKHNIIRKLRNINKSSAPGNFLAQE
jgi:hypothetical protein